MMKPEARQQDTKEMYGEIPLSQLIILLKLINHDRQSILVEIISQEKEGYLAFHEGEIVDACFEDLSGYQAAIQLINIEDGKAEVGLDPDSKSRKTTITTPFRKILLDAARLKDETASTINVQEEGGSTDWDAVIQEAAGIPGMIWGCVLDKNGRILSSSSVAHADEVSAWASSIDIFALLWLYNRIQIGDQNAIIQVSGKDASVFLARWRGGSEYFIAKFDSNTPVEKIPPYISTLISGRQI